MAEYIIQDSTLKNIGNAIREKTGKSEMIPPEKMPDEIKQISDGSSQVSGSIRFNSVPTFGAAIFSDETAKMWKSSISQYAPYTGTTWNNVVYFSFVGSPSQYWKVEGSCEVVLDFQDGFEQSVYRLYKITGECTVSKNT